MPIFSDYNNRVERVKNGNSAVMNNTASSSTKGSAKAAKKKPVKGRIAKYALTPYTKEGFPKTFAKYGSRMQEIEKFRKQAAQLAANSGRCYLVEASELSTTKSSLNNLVFFVDCKNGQRFYMNENDIKHKKKAVSQAEKAWGRAEAIDMCRKMILNEVAHPETADIHTIAGSIYQLADVTKNAIVYIDFEAKNSFGVEDAYTAKCIFPPGASGTIKIARRAQ